MTIFEKAMAIAERYYAKSEHTYTAKMLNGEGFIVQIKTDARDYNAVTRIEKDAKMIIMEIYPGIHCAPEYVPSLTEYIAMVNEKHMCSNLRIQSNGVVYVHSEARFDDEMVGISEDVIKDMEHSALTILMIFSKVLDKLAHGRLLTAAESDIDLVIKNHLNSRIKQMLPDIDDIDISDEDEDDDYEFDSDEKDVQDLLRANLMGLIEESERASTTPDDRPVSKKRSFFEHLFAAHNSSEDETSNDDDESDGKNWLENIIETDED